MGAGSERRRGLHRRQHRRVTEAAAAAEKSTGLQFCVYLGPTEPDARAHAEMLFEQAGLHERPSVLILVAVEQRRVEIVTASTARTRVDDAASARAVSEMTVHFRRGQIVRGIVTGVRHLAAVAGPGSTPAEAHEPLPEILDGLSDRDSP